MALVLPDDCTHVLKHAGETHFMFVLIKNVHLAGIIIGVCWSNFELCTSHYRQNCWELELHTSKTLKTISKIGTHAVVIRGI